MITEVELFQDQTELNQLKPGQIAIVTSPESMIEGHVYIRTPDALVDLTMPANPPFGFSEPEYFTHECRVLQPGESVTLTVD